MLVLGLTNNIQNKLFLYFWEYDNVKEYDALEEAHFLSQVFGIDIYIAESSEGHYHAISFDLMNKRTVERIQKYSVHDGDYKSILETPIYDNRPPYNALRIGVKGRKGSPKFLKVFYAKGNEHLKSLGHLRVYQKLCGFPELPRRLKKLAVNSRVQVCVYNTGIGAKPKRKSEQ